MYKVYVVDDDPMILDEIVANIPWLDNGFEVAGQSSDPILALTEIISIKPQLILSDLKMPRLSGIELMGKVKEAGIDCEYIMLSAYSNFEASRDFFRQHGFDYLLKPVDQQETQIVLERLSAYLSTKKYSVSLENQNIAPSFLNMISYIEENFNKKQNLDMLSKRFGLSTNYICNLFSKHYNTTLTRFLTKIRMENAVKLIEERSMTFKQIALECGYSDYYYFCRVFKEYYGSSPSSYLKTAE